jgi:hypothetical protein
VLIVWMMELACTLDACWRDVVWCGVICMVRSSWFMAWFKRSYSRAGDDRSLHTHS